MAAAPKARKAWRDTERPWIAALDFIGLRHFIYGGDPEWVRRRWFMVMALTIGLLGTIAACVSTSLGRLPIELTKTVIDGYFGMLMIIVPGYILGAAWDAKNKMDSGATVTETTEVVTEEGPPATTTETTTKAIVPPGAPE